MSRVLPGQCDHYKEMKGKQRCYDVGVLSLKELCAVYMIEQNLFQTTEPELIPHDVREFCQSIRLCSIVMCKQPYFTRDSKTTVVSYTQTAVEKVYSEVIQDDLCNSESNTESVKTETEIVVPWSGVCPSCHDSKKYDCETPGCVEKNAHLSAWLCITCGTVNCSRRNQRHAYEHYKASGHPIVVSISMRHSSYAYTFWCYECERWLGISDETLLPSMYDYHKHSSHSHTKLQEQKQDKEQKNDNNTNEKKSCHIS